MGVSKAWLVAGLLAVSACPARALSPAAQTALDDGLRALYGLDYAESRAAFRKLIEKEPDNPFGYLFESGAIWWQASQEYGLFKDTPTLQGLFEQDVDATIKKADALIDSKDKEQRVEGNFAAGMALGTRGQWDLMKGSYMKAVLDGKHAIKNLKKCAKLDPGYEDVNLGLGVYDYEAAHLSGIAKLGILVGFRGDEKRGIERIQRAADQGRYASRQAAQFLLTVYLVDKHDWRSAQPVLAKLRRDFPDSVYFMAVDLMLRWRLSDKEESLKLGRAVFEKAKADPAAFNRKLLSLVCGLAPDACLDRDQAAGSRAWLTAAIDATPEPAPPAPVVAPTLKGRKAAKPSPAPEPVTPDELLYLSSLHLYRGYMADALGRTDEASSDYAWVLSHPAFSDNHARAKACQDEGCPAKELLLHLRTGSREP